MSNDLRTLRLSYDLPAQELVDFIRPFAPKYDKPLQSKAEAPEVYGIQLRPDLLKKLYLKYDPAAWEKRKREKDGHKNPFRRDEIPVFQQKQIHLTSYTHCLPSKVREKPSRFSAALSKSDAISGSRSGRPTRAAKSAAVPENGRSFTAAKSFA